MLDAFEGKLTRLAERLASSAATCPLQTAIYLLLTVLAAAALIGFLARRQTKHAFWSVVALILLNLAFSYGDDTGHHVYRIVVLSEQIRHGSFNGSFTDPATGDAYPIFVYYSFLPFILPVALNLAGIPSLAAFKIAAGLQFIVLAAGLQALIAGIPADVEDEERRSAFLIAILFVTATYVYGLWLFRAAFGEIFAYSFMPWVVKFALQQRTNRSLTAMLFLQICAHPLVFAQSFVGELIVALGLSREAPITVIGRCAGAALIALLFATPFWLPQFLYLHAILGNAALPAQLSDTFLFARDLIDPRFIRNIGLWLPCAVVLMIAYSRVRLSWRIWMMIAVAVALAALQTVYLRAIVLHVPVLDQSQFIWRLMMPTAFAAFGALLGGWGAAERAVPSGSPSLSLSALVLISTGWMTVGQFFQAPGHIVYQASVSFDLGGYRDASGHTSYFDSGNVFGVGLFAPDYSRLPQNCAPVDSHDVQEASFKQLRSGVSAARPYIYVRNGPIGFVRYRADGADAALSACGKGLVLGPLKANDRVMVSEDALHYLLIARVVALAAGLALILVPLPIGKRTARVAQK